MAKFHFTDATVRGIDPPAKSPRIDFDTPKNSNDKLFVAGFAVQTLVSGTKNFLLCYMSPVTGKEQRFKIGRFPNEIGVVDARNRAREVRAEVTMGNDPLDQLTQRKNEQQRKRNSATVGELLEAYCDALNTLKKKDAAKVRREIERNVRDETPALWSTPVTMATVDDLLLPISALVKQGKFRTAQKIRSYLRAAYSLAMVARSDANIAHCFKDITVTANIAAMVAPVHDPNETDTDDAEIEDDEFKGALTQSELAAYWNRIKDLDGLDGAFLRVHLLTGGQRQAQIGRLQKTHIKDDRILIRDVKGRRKKSYIHSIPLLPEALEALEYLDSIGNAPYLLSTTGGKTEMSEDGLRARMRPIVKAMLEAGEINEPFTPGAIRKTVASLLSQAGISRENRNVLLSHNLGGVDNKHYQTYKFFDEKLAALKTFRALCEPTPDNVTPITRKTA